MNRRASPVIRQRELGDRTIVELGGEIDLETSPRVREQLLTCVQEARDLVVDLGRVTYIDSSGIASLIEAFQTARNDDLRFALTGVSQPVLRVFQLARLDKIFPFLAAPDAPFEGPSS